MCVYCLVAGNKDVWLVDISKNATIGAVHIYQNYQPSNFYVFFFIIRPEVLIWDIFSKKEEDHIGSIITMDWSLLVLRILKR